MSTQRTQDKTLIEQWSVAPTVSLPTKKDLFEMSTGVASFDTEANTIITEARRNLSEQSVVVAKVKLQDEFMWHFESSTSSADKRVTDSPKRLRKTLIDLYRSYYAELRQLARQVTPLLHISNEPPAQQQSPQFEGIYLGHDLGRALKFE